MDIAKQTLKLIKELKKTYEFNGIDIEYIELEGCWHREYSIFIISFDTYDLGEYFEYWRFEKDFRDYVKTWFPDCQIKYYDGCCEIEVIGPNNKLFYEKYSGEIEDYMEKHGDKKMVIFRK